ncbi:hypothetical protein [Opitutus sp. ER46]|uniref:hypothetical protein n=1 Tax=Opitutus sp. ER46 TaxID=2161864 RepID=UPI000D2F9FC5|nr:hypothetical protein [Opitutus sp. ER46]PTX90741.1 hypothetical protein DB354_18955 [Opitutus sp. ER46]
MFRAALSLLLLGLLAPLAGAADASVVAFSQVEIAPTKTSIYVGSVSLTMPAFTRAEGSYTSRYTAHVFPWAFYNEAGVIRVDVSDDQLRQLARGEPIEFTGQARTEDGSERRVAGKATPQDATSGRIKVRVFVSTRIQLIFNTTYRFPPAVAK